MRPRAVILRHTLPDASTHLDLLLERPPASPQLANDPDDPRLIAFRIPDPLPVAPHADLDALRLPDHRAHYLTHEGQIDARRGRVTRLLSASLTDLLETPSHLTATLKSDSETVRISATHVSSDHWRLTLTRHAPDVPAADR